MNRTILNVILATLLVGPTTALAQSSTQDLADTTRFLEALRTNDLEEASSAYQAIPTKSRTIRLRYLSATVDYRLARYKECSRTLEQLLQEEDNHLAALYLQARVRMRQGDDIEARRLLIKAGAAGQFVFRDIRTGEERELFEPLLNDPDFVLRLIRASQESRNRARGKVHNPFAPAVFINDGKRPIKKNPKDLAARAAQLDRQIEALLRELEGELNDTEGYDPEVVLTKLERVYALIKELDDLGLKTFQDKLDDFRSRVAGFENIRRSIQLQLWIEEGNRHLRAMSKALAKDDFRTTLSEFARLQQLCERMKAKKDDIYTRNADALLLRGRRFQERANLLQRIKGLELVITGVVITKQKGEVSLAIVNDRPYAVGDVIEDPKTNEPIRGLVLVGLENGAVSFRLEGETFTRFLPRPRN